VPDVRDVCIHIQGIVKALSGMKEAPDDPRAGAFSWPFALTYPAHGTFDSGPAGSSTGLHHIATDIMYARQPDLGLAYKTLGAYVDDFPAAILADPTLGGHVTTIVSGADGPPLSYTMGSGLYAGIEVIALRFDLAVKILNTVP
jgi:hypothetical protein